MFPQKQILIGFAIVTMMVVFCMSAGAENALTYEKVVLLAREYMDNEDAGRRAEILRTVGNWNTRLDDIALALRPVPPTNAPKGLLYLDKFTVPRLRAKMACLVPGKGNVPISPTFQYKKGYLPHEEYLNFVYVPESYHPDKPLGMVIFLHGGGGETDQEYPLGSILSVPDGMNNSYYDSDLVRNDDFITVCPSTPPMPENKFNIPESGTHMSAVIEEYSTRYAIDPQRIYLVGVSMGGGGCWHHAFYQPDRYALIAPIVGWWVTAYWPMLRGAMIYMVNGAMDGFERKGGGTSPGYTRYAHERMRFYGIPHIDAEFPAGHEPACFRPQSEALFKMIAKTRRDPYCPRVCAVSPFNSYIGYGSSYAKQNEKRFPLQPYNRWISVLEIGTNGGILVETASRNSKKKNIDVSRKLMMSGAVEAENLGGNKFRIKVTNVHKFALWLHPKMGVDLARPIEITLIKTTCDPKQGKEVEICRKQLEPLPVKPSLGAMLRYLGARRDFGLIYHAVLEVDTSNYF